MYAPFGLKFMCHFDSSGFCVMIESGICDCAVLVTTWEFKANATTKMSFRMYQHELSVHRLAASAR
jgi:hypothetical protein